MADADFKLVPNVRGKSDIWKYFGLKKRKVDGQIVDNIAICNSCQAEVKTSGGTSNLFFHMSRQHPHVDAPKKARKRAQGESLGIPKIPVFRTGTRFNTGTVYRCRVCPYRQPY